MTKFPHVFSPIQIGGITVKNRLFSAPMGSHRLTLDGFVTPETIDFYANLAKGGVGLVCIGETLVDAEIGNNHGQVLKLDNPETIPGLYRLTDAIHRYGALASIELVHPGQRADPKYNKDNVVYGPSGGKCHYGDGFNTIVEMDEAMIQRTVEAYGTAAEMAKLAGCDMVTVHGGHGWLLNQFLTPANNHRTDRFGGSIENRCRIFLMVADEIRKKCGPCFPIDFRISGDDLIENGATLEDTVYLAKALEPKIDTIHVSATSFHNRRASIRMFPSMFYPRGVNAIFAEEIKKHISIPVTTVGGFNDPAHMERQIAEGKADIIALGRALIADPMLPEKARTGREDDIIYCIRCNQCMSADFVPYVKYAMGVSHCSVNPWHGLITEQKLEKKPAGRQKVLVIGGGPAGMEAALGAAECGHSVTLCEKSGTLGGMLQYAWLPDYKRDIKNHFVDVLEKRIRRAENIDLRLNCTATPEFIRSFAPDALIVAIGAEPVAPPIPGIADARVLHATEAAGRTLAGKSIVIIGGGLIGCEAALELAKEDKDRQITIVEMTDTLMPGAAYVHYLAVVNEFEQHPNIRFAMKNRVTGIEPDGVHTMDADGKTHVYPAEHIIVAVGMKPRRAEAEAYRGLAPQVCIVGDCYKASQMNEAVLAGYFAGYNLERA